MSQTINKSNSPKNKTTNNNLEQKQTEQGKNQQQTNNWKGQSISPKKDITID